MMQSSEIQQRFNHIEQTVKQMSQACQSSPDVPSDLKQCISELDQQTGKAKQVMQSQDENQIIQCVDSLEDLGDRAKAACEQAGNLNQNVRDAVMQAHQELSDLKHNLH
jgi:phage shock protein A